MGERSDLLERLARYVPPPGEALQRLLRRRERRARRARLAAGAAAIAVAAAGIASVVAAFRGTEPGPDREQVDAIAAAIPEGLEVPPGRFWNRELLFYGLNQCWDGALDSGSEADADFTGAACGFSNEFGEAQPDRYPYVGVSVHRVWWSADGPARVSERKLRAELFTEEERADFVERYGPVEPLRWETEEFWPGEYAEHYPDEDPAHGLSTDPEVLARQLLERLAPGAPSPVPEVTSGPGQDPDTARLWRVVEAILPTAQPTLQAAMFEVMSDWPDTEVMTGVRDPVGRHAILLQVTTEGGHHAWWFNPDTHQVLANVETWRGVPQTAIIVVSSGFVEEIRDSVPAPASLVAAPLTAVSPMRDPRAPMRPAS
jgi:hypothetical protein